MEALELAKRAETLLETSTGFQDRKALVVEAKVMKAKVLLCLKQFASAKKLLKKASASRNQRGEQLEEVVKFLFCFL